jgi:hypothetical protein
VSGRPTRNHYILNKWSINSSRELVYFRPREGRKQIETGTLQQRFSLATTPHLVGELAVRRSRQVSVACQDDRIGEPSSYEVVS